jgi:hypothetical protein
VTVWWILLTLNYSVPGERPSATAMAFATEAECREFMGTKRYEGTLAVRCIKVEAEPQL